ncbi:Lipase 5 [Cladophialophora chaetospira]|uniref:Lipase 5 n=1 Tax=Cladophialophora chaetospira TaxID=386627 RepID=A0AA38X478_9EURO|nr:Lipase 5 [Cladophialophora chaetospira]
MAILLSVVPSHSPIFWSCVGVYADVIKLLSPSKRLQRLAEEIARYSRRPPETPEQALVRRMDEAETLTEYESCTVDLDKLQGHEAWKQEKDSIEPGYNPEIIEKQMVRLKHAVIDQDRGALEYILRTGLSRDLGGMNSLRLYKHSWFGTKKLIDEYIETVLQSVETFSETSSRNDIPTTEVRLHQQSLEDALKFFGRSALTLSGGALLGMKHVGVVKTLWEAELLPEIISGASAGSIVAGIVGSSTDERMEEVLERFPFSDLAVFDPPGTGRIGWAKHRIGTLLRTGAFFEMDNLKKVMKTWLGDITFREAHYKTGRVVNICVSSAGSAEPRLLNFVTAPDVFIWSAVCASCAVPWVFSPANIYEKDPITKEEKLWMQNAQQTFVDGSLDHDIPMRKLSEMFNVNFFIVSQVNPHVRVFLDQEEIFRGKQPAAPVPSRYPFQATKEYVRREVIHRAQQFADLGISRRLYRWTSLFNQQYTGDINILPDIRPSEYLNMMMNPTSEFMLRAIVAGERATWPRMCRIKNCVAIELALTEAIYTLRDRVNFGPEARAAREQKRSSSRGRSGRGRSARPSFLRRRSLSIESPVDGENGPPSPLRVRRNASLGSISLRQGLPLTTPPRTTPYLSPQVGIEQDIFADALAMTSVNSQPLNGSLTDSHVLEV